jgi:hypothetical protein
MPRCAVARKMDDEFEMDEIMIDEQIRDFLDGRTDGEEPLHALYDHVLEEPLPPRLLDPLRR